MAGEDAGWFGCGGGGGATIIRGGWGNGIVILRHLCYGLGTTALVEGSAAGSDSVVLAGTPTFGPWTATPSASWLHLTLANQSGNGSANVVFSFDANPGATRSGTINIAGQNLTVTQAGTTYIAAPAPMTTLVTDLGYPGGLALDLTGDVFVADTAHNALKEWTLANNTADHVEHLGPI